MRATSSGHDLVRVAQSLNFATQKTLRDIEDEFALQRYYVSLSGLTRSEKQFMLLTSLPWVIHEEPKLDFVTVWDAALQLGGRRLVVPTGNLAAHYAVVGDAPSDMGEPQNIGFERAWVYKNTSKLLRLALAKLNVHWFCWYTNLLKTSTPENRPSTTEEQALHFPILQRELYDLHPRKVILLGKHVQESFRLDYDTVHIPHPSYALRMGWSSETYAQYIYEAL